MDKIQKCVVFQNFLINCHHCLFVSRCKKEKGVKWWKVHFSTQCLKIAKKVAFNIVSEASYIYILSGHKLIKKWSILASFWKPDVCGQTVLPDRSLFIGQKSVEKAKIRKLKMWHFSWFSNTVFLFSWTQSPKGVKHLHFSYLWTQSF